MHDKKGLYVLAATLFLLAVFTAPAEAEERRPDLVITDVWVDLPEEAKADVMNTYSVNYEITNIGSAPANGAGISCLYVDGVHGADDDLEEITLEPGESYRSVFRDYEPPCNCSINLTVCADNYDDVREHDETNNCLRKRWICPWNFKPAFPNYAPSGMPDFDQKQDKWRNSNGQWSFCGPVAVANCLWWFDSMYADPKGTPGDGKDIFPLVKDYGAPYPWIPGPRSDDHNFDNVDDRGTPWPPGNELVERLARCMDTDGVSSGSSHSGTNVYTMQRCIDTWLTETGLNCTLYEHTEKSPEFYWIEKELKRCQNIILLLGFWYYDAEAGKWVRIGGHYVTVAGINSEENLIALSDPYLDNAVVTGRGRVLPPWHPLVYPTTLHNDPLYVSHDYYHVKPKSPSPGGEWWIPDYPITNALLENFKGMNVPEETVVPSSEEIPLPERVRVEIEYAVVVSPCKTLISVDDKGNETNDFVPGTNVSVQGCGFKPNSTYGIYIQPNPVVEGQRLNASNDPSGRQERITTDAKGCFGPVVIWKIPVEEPACSDWDIVVDFAPSSVVPIYNARDDGLDNVCCSGFHVACLPGIDVTKTVWNGTAWVEGMKANIHDMVRFRCEIHNNGTCCPLSELVATDILPLNMKYMNNATVHYPNCTTVPQEPSLVGLPNIFTWQFPNFVLMPSQSLTIEFDANVIQCSEGENVQRVKAWCEKTGKHVDDEDHAEVTVLCPDLVVEEKWEERVPMRKYLHVKPPIDPRKPIEDPECTRWHELYPDYCRWYHLSDWRDNADRVLSPCDRIKLSDESGTGTWYHVDDVTITLFVSTSVDPERKMAIEFDGGYKQINETMYNPICTYWYEVHPAFCPMYHLKDWGDNGDEYLSSCDWILLESETGESSRWHVDNVTTDIIVSPLAVVAPDNTYAVWYTIHNNGTATAQAGHFTTLYVDNCTVEHNVVPVDLGPSETYTDSFRTVVNYTPPEDEVIVCTDDYNTIEELDEENNCQINKRICGDVNCDGAVDMSDVIDLLYYVGYPGHYTICSEWAADVNCDNARDMLDMRMLLYYVGYPGLYELKCC